MPMTRYNSGSTLNRNNNFNTLDSSYSEDKLSNVYRSSPDLSHGSLSHRRYSSTDSMDSSHHSSHSRQGSESNEAGYPTRRMSTQLSRKSSTSTDPLQFIKGKAGAKELAHTAQVQMRVAAESKTLKTTPRTSSEDDAEWQANLSSWKSRRKSQSERSYALKESLEESEREKSGEGGTNLPTKTFSQMQEERTRRQSLPSRKFYPIEDDEDDAFLPSDTRSSSQSKSSKENQDPWSSDREEDGEDSKLTKSSSSFTRASPLRSSDQNDKNNNNDLSGGFPSQRVKAEDEEPQSRFTRSTSRSKLLEKYREIDNEDDNNFSSTSSSSRNRKSGMQGIVDNDSDTFGSSSLDHKSSNNSSFSKTKDNFHRGDSMERERDGSSAGGSVSVRTSGNVGPRNQGKIGNIMKNFEQSESKSTIPKQGYNEKIDLSNRKKMFEQPPAETNVRSSTINSGYSSSQKFGGGGFGGGRSSDEVSGDSDYTSSDERKSAREPKTYGSQSGESSLKFGSAFSGSKGDGMGSGIHSAREFSTGRKDFLETSKASSENADESLEAEEGFSRSDYHSASATPSSLSSSSLVGPTSSSAAVYASAKMTGRDFVEKNIRISQKPNSDRGFGFILTGGVDKGSPLTVSKVNLGSAADVCDLRSKDVVLGIDGQDLSGHSSMEVGDLVARAVTTGHIEIRVKRELGDDDEEDEEDFSDSSEEGEEDVSSPGYRQTVAEMNQPDEDLSIENELNAERAWLEEQMKGGREDMMRPVEAAPQMAQVSAPTETLHETDSGHQVEIESRQTFTLSRPQEKVKDEDPDSPSPGSIGHSEDSDGSGPPAILRKWQRQRQKEEYTFDSPETSTTSPIYKKISLNASLPRRDSDADEGTAQPKVQSIFSTQLTRPWDERMDEWTQKQDQERQPDPQHTWKVKDEDELTEAQYEEERDRIRQQYERDLREAEQKENESLQKEQEMLQPEMDKARLLEERRAERRARIQKEATGATSSSSSQAYEQEPAGAVNGTAASSGQEMHVTSMMFNLNQSQPQQAVPGPYTQTQGRFGLPSGPQGGTIIIDPRNRQMHAEPGAPVEFQVKLDQSDLNTAAALEKERERIRQEEKKNIEEEKRRVEEERRARDEEMRKIREKEEYLQQQEEKLRQQREQFLREQEEFKRLQEQQLRQHQQQQQQQAPPPPPAPANYHIQPHDTQGAPPPKDLNRFSPQRSRSPNSPYAPVPFHPPKPMNDVGRPTTQFPTPAYPVSSSQPTHHQPYQATSSVPHYQPATAQPPQQWTPRSSEPQQPSSKSLPRWPPNDTTTNISTTTNNNMDAGRGKRFSRDEMLAMNRKATPLQATPPQHSQEPQNDTSSYQPHIGPITRESPSRTDIVNLNSAPKAKLKDDAEWYGHGQINARPSPRQQQKQQQAPPPPWETARQRGGGGGGGKFSFSGPGDHWLIQEAERRRIAESDGTRLGPIKPGPRGPSPTSHFSGPIKPSGEVNNRWRDNNGYRDDQGDNDHPSPSMPAAIRQTLLQKTATARGPNGSTGSPEQLSPLGQYSPASLSPSQPEYSNYRNSREASPSHRSTSPRHQQQQLHHQPHQYQQQQQQQYYPGPSTHGGYQAPPSVPAPPTSGDNGVAVSGTQLCSQCNQELGFGAAMVIESLGLYFHVQCFRCCVCHASLGTGSQGADVRVRHNRLHCPNCYSNDEAGLKFSKV